VSNKSTVLRLLPTSSNHPKNNTTITSILLELEVGGVLSVGWEWVKTSDLVPTITIITDSLHQLTTDGEFPSIWGLGIPFKSLNGFNFSEDRLWGELFWWLAKFYNRSKR